MNVLNIDEIKKLGRLARLRLSDEEITKYQLELSAILDYVTLLDKVDLAGLNPTYQVTGLTNVTRQDDIKDYHSTPKDLLINVPALESGHIKVKRML